MLLTALCLAWLAGIAVGLTSAAPDAAWASLVGLAALLVATTRSRPRVAGGCLLAVALALGAFRAQAHQQTLAVDPLEGLRGQGVVRLRGLVAREPEVGDVTARWAFQVAAARSPGAQGWQDQAGLVLVYSRWLPPVRYGQELELRGKLEAPPRLDNFAYDEYLARQGIRAVMRYPAVSVLAEDRGNPAVAQALALRGRLAESLQRALPEPQGALAQGILLGLRGAIPRGIEEDFRRTATTHILAISGHNLSVVAGLLAAAGAWLLGRRHRAYFIAMLLALWGYAALTGLAPSVVRAAIMASMVLAAGLAGRQPFAPSALLLAAGVMTLVDPGLLRDIGFQLSFGAMAGILFASPLLAPLGSRLLAERTPAPWVVETLGRYVGPAVAALMGASLTTVPIQAFHFQSVPLMALPATLFALPALPGVLLGAFATAVVGLLAPPLATVPAAVTWAFGSYMLGVVHWWAQAPAASVSTPATPAFLAWAYGVFLAGALWAGHRWAKRLDPVSTPAPRPATDPVRSALPTLGALLLPGAAALLTLANLLVWRQLLLPVEPAVHVRFLDVGQGDATLVETAAGQRVLIDGGPSPAALLDALGRRMPQWERRLDLVVLTHPQRDHITGLLAALQRYQVGAALESGQPGEGADYREWERLLRERGVRRVQVAAGARIQLSDAVIEVLHPSPRTLRAFAGRPNEASLVLRLEAYGQSVLLPGDIERGGEAALLALQPALTSSMLKLPHHGSKTSSSQGFLDAVAPLAAVVSVGKDNSFGHPSREVLERLGDLPVLRTDLDGSVELVLRPRGVEVRGERPRGAP
ncbi:MAG: ComEC/Rec2 family competence protein [Chloroflexi bacterium]|nr:ComEC/Rec2 family competence protein [Chloroflexota bacterium]